MIHYDLRCDEGHAFDGWFAGSAAFDTQRQGGLLECPSCGSLEVDRALMTPSVTTSRPDRPRLPPAKIVAALQKLRQDVEANCENVGTNFAPTALAMHRGELEHRAIYGQADADQAADLRDEGVQIMLLPWVRPADG